MMDEIQDDYICEYFVSRNMYVNFNYDDFLDNVILEIYYPKLDRMNEFLMLNDSIIYKHTENDLNFFEELRKPL